MSAEREHQEHPEESQECLVPEKINVSKCSTNLGYFHLYLEYTSAKQYLFLTLAREDLELIIQQASKLIKEV